MTVMDFNGIIVAFDCPSEVSEHPDVRLEFTKYNGADVIAWAYLRGCKNCQKLASLCSCNTPTVTERWVYDRSRGLHEGMYTRVNPRWREMQPGFVPVKTKKSAPPPQNPLRKEELAGLAAIVDRDEDGDSKAPPLSEFQTRINPLLIAHLLTVGVNNYLTYPATKLEEMSKLFESRGRKLHIRPLSEPKPGTTTVRGGCSATITFPSPKDMGILSQYPAAMGQVEGHVVLHDYKLALQLFFDHGFDLMGPAWEAK